MPFDLISALGGFLVGTATGAAGKYMADRFTDQRREQESRAQATGNLASVRAKVPDLLAEIKKDVRRNPLVREAIVLRHDAIQYTHRHERFVYYEESHPEVRKEFNFLVSVGYAEQVSNGEFPLYRLSEAFVDAVSNEP